RAAPGAGLESAHAAPLVAPDDPSAGTGRGRPEPGRRTPAAGAGPRRRRAPSVAACRRGPEPRDHPPAIQGPAMCLILFAWRPGHTVPLVVAANRDEFYARPALPLAEWADAPGLLAGRDLEAGGTWLGLTRGGRFAALTNIRAPGKPLGRLSRGELPSQFLQ